MMPEQLLSPGTNRIDRDGFVNHAIEATNVNVFEGVWRLAKTSVQLLVFARFEEVNFGANRVSADIGKGCVAFTSQIQTVLSSCKEIGVLQIWKDEWMCVELASEDMTMDDNVLCLCKLMVTDDRHVTSKVIVSIKPTMNCLSAEQTRRAAAGCNNAVRTD